MTRFKKVSAALAACVLTAAVTVGGTMAYLSAVTDTKENKFTSSKGLTGEITETEWKYTDSAWSDYMPGDSTGKNPVISIDDKGVDAYVGMKVSCVDGEGKEISFENFQKDYATVSYNGETGTNAKWVKGDNDFYVYSEVVPANKATEPLFDQVTINIGIVRAYTVTTGVETVTTYKTDENGNKIPSTKFVKEGDVVVFDEDTTVSLVGADGKVIKTILGQDASLPTFQINVTGYAIQKSGNENIYTAELRKLAGL